MEKQTKGVFIMAVLIIYVVIKGLMNMTGFGFFMALLIGVGLTLWAENVRPASEDAVEDAE